MDKLVREISSPWSKTEVDYLNFEQNGGRYHPYTCRKNTKKCKNLIATENGWICPYCNYTQNWASINDARYIQFLQNERDKKIDQIL